MGNKYYFIVFGNVNNKDYAHGIILDENEDLMHAICTFGNVYGVKCVASREDLEEKIKQLGENEYEANIID